VGRQDNVKEICCKTGVEVDFNIFSIVVMILKSKSFYTLQPTIMSHSGFCHCIIECLTL